MKKKVVFLQIEGNNYGGVCQVNKLVAEELLKNNYDVSIISFRNDKKNADLGYDKKLKIVTINEVDEWGTYHFKDISGVLKKGQIFKIFDMLI